MAAVAYSRYLRLARLLSCQKPLTRAHDERLFIAVHQAFEIWFSLILFELEAARAAMGRADARWAARALRRVGAVLRALLPCFDVIETMPARDFLEFREGLEPASGFQSIQFRQIEFLSGAKDPRYLAVLGRSARETLRRRLAEPTLWDAYVGLLARRGFRADSDKRILRAVTGIFERPGRHPLWDLTEAMLSYDQLFSQLRARHAQTALRLIGEKPGTGARTAQALVRAGYDRMGEAGGVAYLRTTLAKTFFPLLWQAQTRVRKR